MTIEPDLERYRTMPLALCVLVHVESKDVLDRHRLAGDRTLLMLYVCTTIIVL